MNTFQADSWAIDLLDEWVGEHGEDCSTIYHPDGVGTLQISSFSKGSEVSESDLKDLAKEHIESGAKLATALSGEFNGFTLAFGANGEFWQYWYVAKKHTALLITYNCNEADLGPERDQAKSMVVSLKAA